MALRLGQSVMLLNKALESAGGREQKDDISRIYSALYEVNGSLRERLREQLRPELEDIMRTLDALIPLTPEQLVTLRSFIIGDAESYVRQEKDYASWHGELNQLSAAIAAVNPENASREALASMQGHITDALNLIPSIQKYLEARDRIARFEQSVSNIDQAKAELLITLIRTKLNSANS